MATTLPASNTENRAVVEKAFTVLEAWTHRSEILGVSELARRTGLAKTTAHRVLGTLEASAVIERVDGGYRIGDRIHGFTELLFPWHQRQLRDVVLPFIQDLYELTHETVHVAALDGVTVHCVEKIHGHRRSPLRTRVGGFLPAHSTALGKVLLAFASHETRQSALGGTLPAYTPATVTQPLRLSAELRTAARHGVAYDRQETHPEVSCIAAPLLDQDGRAVAAISVSGPTHRFNPDAVALPLRRAARSASYALTATTTDTKAA